MRIEPNDPESGNRYYRRMYWATALRFYAEAAILQSVAIWGTALLLPLALWMLHGFRQRSIQGTLATMAMGIAVGGLFFVAMFGTAVGYDLKRNWGQREPMLEWKPLLFWKLFLYAGSLMFLAFGFLLYRQDRWLTIEFGGFAVLCWLSAHVIAATVRIPKGASDTEKTENGVSSSHRSKAVNWGGGHLHSGFVRMEYFALILNKSFLVFIADDGLRI